MALVMLAACSGTDSDKKEKEGVETILPSQVNEVTVMELPLLMVTVMCLQ